MNDATMMPHPGATLAQGAAQARLLYLARLRDAFGTSGEAVALPASGTLSVGALVTQLRARGGAFAHELAPGRAFRVAVNQALAPDDTPIRPGDEVAFLPPVTGG